MNVVSIQKLVSRATLLLLAVLMAAGCSVLEPVVDRRRFYSLAGASGLAQFAAVAPAEAPTIGVRLTSAASHLRQEAIAVRTGEHEVRFEAEHRWTEPPSEAFVRCLAGAMQRAAGSRLPVRVAPPLRSPSPAVLVEIDLLACEGRRGAENAALLVADWRIFKGREENPAASGRFRVERDGWDGADFAQLTGLLSAAVEDLGGALGGPAITIATQ